MKIITSEPIETQAGKTPSSYPIKIFRRLAALFYRALLLCAFELCFLYSPAPAISTAAAIPPPAPAISTAAAISQAELDLRAPLAPQDSNRFGPGVSQMHLKRIYQSTLLATQGGAIPATVKHIAVIAGFSVRTIQRRHRELEARGLIVVKSHRKHAPWVGRNGKHYRTYNDPNTYRFPLRERQLNFFVTLSQKNLKTQYKSNQNVPVMWKCNRRTRPNDHPAGLRAAWEARRRANHPPEPRRRYEERAAQWEFMRGWRYKRETRILSDASRSLVGLRFDSEEERRAVLLDRAEAMGVGPRRRRKLEAELAEPVAAAISPAGNSHPANAPAAISAAAAEPAKLEASAQGVAFGFPPEGYKSANSPRKAEPTCRVNSPTAPTELHEESTTTAAAISGEVCPLCDGRRRRILGGRIVVCVCAPPGDERRVV